MWHGWSPRTSVRRTRESVADRFQRIADAGPAIAQTTAAAGLAWLVAEWVLPQERPAFAPLTAIIALAATRGQRGGRAVQVAAGVAVGVGVAVLIVRLLGVGAWQLAAVTALALTVAVFVSSGPVLIVQAGVSGALVVALGPTESVAANRFTEAVLGGAVALAFTQVLFPFDAVGAVRAAVSSVLGDTAETLARGAAAVRRSESDRARAAQEGLREVIGEIAGVESALSEARTNLRLTRRRFSSVELDRWEDVVDVVGRVVGDSGALLRTAARLVEGDSDVPPGLGDAIACVAEAAGCLAENLDVPPDRLEGPCRRGTARATSVVQRDERPSIVTAVTLLRSACEGLLRIAGADVRDARSALAEAAHEGRASAPS